MKDKKRFYEICYELYHLAPWEFLENNDYCQILLKELAYPVFISVMGAGGLEFGFIICTNSIQSNYLLTHNENIKESDISSFRRSQYLGVSYESYKNINSNDKRTLRTFFGSLKRDSYYPILKKYSWNRALEDANDKEYSDVCYILENLFMLLINVREEKIKKSDSKVLEYPTRIYNSKTQQFDNFYAPLIEDYFLLNPRFILNTNKTYIFNNKPFISTIVEYDVLYLPIKNKDDSLMLVYVLIDVEKQFILDFSLLDSNGDRNVLFAEKYLDSLNKFGIFQEIRCRDSIDKKLLESLNIPKKPKIIVKPLRNIDNILKGFLNRYV